MCVASGCVACCCIWVFARNLYAIELVMHTHTCTCIAMTLSRRWVKQVYSVFVGKFSNLSAYIYIN